MNLNDVLIDSAVAGILTLGVGGNADVTLSSVQGAPDQARNADFIFTGVLTGNVNVFWPVGRNRFFSVKNATTGAFTLTIAVTGTPGTTVSVPQGQTVMLKSDGTNIAPRFTSLVGPLSFTGGVSADLLTIVTDQIFTRPVVTGTGNAIVLTYATTPGAYVDGAKFAFKATAANTGPTSVAINALGAKGLFKKIPTGGVAPCAGGEIHVGDIIEFEYDGAQFQILSNIGTVTGASVATTLAGTDATQALTALGFAGNKSLAANGYMKYPGGLTIQWLTVTETGPVTGAVGLPISFSSQFFGISGSCASPGASVAVTAVPLSLGTFTFSQSAATAALNYFFVAIGI